MNAVGIEPAIIENEKCCGHDHLWRGQFDFFDSFAKQNAKHLKDFKTIITSCPECYRTLAVDYKERLGLGLNVVHISEFIVEKMENLDFKASASVTFHDSCRLGRYMNVYQPPREALKKAGYSLKEMQRTKEGAWCCGVSAFVNCDDENKEIRRRRMKDAIETGSEILVTTCPKCQIHLKCLQNDESEPEYKIKISDFSTVLMEGLKR